VLAVALVCTTSMRGSLLAVGVAALANAQMPSHFSNEEMTNLLADGTPKLDKPRHSGIMKKDGTVPEEWKPFVALSGQKFQGRSGFHAVLSGDSSTVAVGAPMDSNDLGQAAGSVTVYKRAGTIWYMMGFPIHGDTKHEQSGFSVSLSFAGDTVAMGSPYHNISNLDDNYEQEVPYAGKVRVFTWGGICDGPCVGKWSQLGDPLLGDEAMQLCGFSVHMGAMGRNLIFGCPRKNDHENVRPNAGQVRVFKWMDDDMGTGWRMKGNPVFGNTTNIMAGVRVSMSGDSNTIAFMAPGLNEKSLGDAPGRVRVFGYVGPDPGHSDWEQIGEPIVNWDENDKRGRAMHMSRDGLNVAIGSPSKEKHRSGHVRVYTWTGTTWREKGEPVPGAGSYHTVGHSVALNTDATIMAVGSPFSSAKGKTAGRVRVYKWKDDRKKGGVLTPGWVLKGQKIDGDAGDTNGFSVHISGKGNMIAVGAPQYKHKKDRDPLFFNVAVEPPKDYDDEEDTEDDEEYDDDEDPADHFADDVLGPEDELVTCYESAKLRSNANAKRTALSSAPGENGKHYPGHEWHDPSFYKKHGYGRVRIQGCFECKFRGDLTPPDNPYSAVQEAEAEADR